MPRRREAEKPPKAMTWARAAPIIVVSVIFDAARFFFTLFWFFGPALFDAYCTYKGGKILSTYTLGVLGTKTAALACTGASVAIGASTIGALIAFGVVMALLVGLLGWLVIGLLTLLVDARILKHPSNLVALVIGLFGSEMPFLDALPFLTGTTLKIFHTQIKTDRVALKAYRRQRQAAQDEQRAAATRLLVAMQEEQLQEAQLATVAAAEAANDAEYDADERQDTMNAHYAQRPRRAA
jgi:hypothetical protein